MIEKKEAARVLSIELESIIVEADIDIIIQADNDIHFLLNDGCYCRMRESEFYQYLEDLKEDETYLMVA